MTNPVKSPIEMMYQWENEVPDDIFLRQPDNLVWSEYTWREVADQVRRIATFLLEKKYPQGSRIAIWSSNSKDWVICDLAIMLSGHVSVPIYPGQDLNSAQYILQHSDSKLIFTGDFDQYKGFADIVPPGVESVAMTGCRVPCDTSLVDVLANYSPYGESPIPNPDDMFTIIYTSGTTGNPKGVMHMHKTPGYVVPDLIKVFKLSDDEGESRMFSFLPMAHAAERIVVEMSAIYSNTPISFSAGLETFGDEIRSVQPTLFFAVPRLWTKFKEGIDSKIPPEVQKTLSDEQKLQLRQQLGLGSARFILTGAAPCSKDLMSWFLDKGIILREGYGMTENFIHGVCWSHSDTPKLGSVGQPMSDSVKFKISEKGEILFSSKGLMQGYYKNPETTAEVLIDNWYYSGDSGRIDEDGDLYVTGRISEVFKTSKGKFVKPTILENLFARSPLLAQICVCGHGKDSAILLATLSELGKKYEKEQLIKELQALITEVNEELNPWEKVAQIYLSDEWTIENSLLTPTMKLRRKQIEESFSDNIEANLDSGVTVNFPLT